MSPLKMFEIIKLFSKLPAYPFWGASSVLLPVVLAADFAAAADTCKPDSPLSSPLFHSGPINLEGIKSILPLGSIDARGRHIIPSGQLEIVWNWTQNTEPRSVQVLAPAQITRVTKFTSNGATDYSVHFQYTCSLHGWYQNLSTLDVGLVTYLRAHTADAGVSWDSPNWDYNLANHQLSYAFVTQATVGTVINPNAHPLGIGISDKRIRNGSFMNASMERQPDSYAALSFLHYADADTQNSWQAVSPSSGDGAVGLDIPGRLQGTWFNPAIDQQKSVQSSDAATAAMSIARDVSHADQTAIAWGSMASAQSTSSALGGLASLDPLNWGVNCKLPSSAAACEALGTPPALYGQPGGRPAVDFFGYSVRINSESGLNPDPSTVSANQTVCYDLKRAGDTVTDYLLARIESPGESGAVGDVLNGDNLYLKYYPKGSPSGSPCQDLLAQNGGSFPARNASWKLFNRKIPASRARVLGAPVDLSTVASISYAQVDPVKNQILPANSANITFKGCPGGCSLPVRAMDGGKVYFISAQNNGVSLNYNVSIAHYDAEPADTRTAPRPLVTMLSGINSLSINTQGKTWWHVDGSGEIAPTTDNPETTQGFGIWILPLNQPAGGGFINPQSGYIDIVKGAQIGTISVSASGAAADGTPAAVGVQVLDGATVNGSFVNSSHFRYPPEYDRLENLPPDAQGRPYMRVNSDVYWFLPHTYMNNYSFVRYLDPAIREDWVAHYAGVNIPGSVPGAAPDFYHAGQDVLNTARGIWFEPELDTHFATLPPFNLGTGLWDSNAGTLAMVPRWNNLAQTTITWGLATNTSYDNSFLPQLDPANWAVCKTGSDSECYDKQQRPASYPTDHIDQAFHVTAVSSLIAPGYYRNPLPQEISVGSMACYDLPHLDAAGNVNYYDQLWVFLASPNALKLKYRAVSAAPTAAPCSSVSSVDVFPAKEDVYWKTYVR
jgi:hypothetical protein